MGTLVDSFANQVFDADGPRAYIAQASEGGAVGMVAYTLAQAAHGIAERGGDVATMRTVGYRELKSLGLDELAETYMLECEGAMACARAEAKEHYGDTGSHVKVPALRSTRGLRGGDAS